MATYQGNIRETCEIRKARLTNDKNKPKSIKKSNKQNSTFKIIIITFATQFNKYSIKIS